MPHQNLANLAVYAAMLSSSLNVYAADEKSKEVIELHIAADRKVTHHHKVIEAATKTKTDKVTIDAKTVAVWFQVAGDALRHDSERFVTRKEKDGTLQALLLLGPNDIFAQHFARARADYDIAARPCINVEFNDKGARRIHKLTSDNVERKLCIAIDRKIVSAATIRSAISERTVIAGEFTQKQVDAMVKKINSTIK